MCALALKDVATTLYRRYGGLESLDEPRPLDQLILLILSEGSTSKKAKQALTELRLRFVDWNEVRVSGRYEIVSAIEATGKRGIDEKARRIKQVLATIYSRFNRVNLDFMHDHDREDRTVPRKRERLLNDISEFSAAYPAVFGPYLNQRDFNAIVTGGMSRVLLRLKLFPKGTSAAPMRKKIEAEIAAENRIPFVWGVHLVSDHSCHRSNPDCPSCPLKADCKTAPAEIEKIRVARKLEQEKARKAAAKKAAEEKAREERERKEATKRLMEERQKTLAKREAEEKKKAAAKKKADAKRAAEAKKKAALKKKVDAKRKAEAKKAAEAKKKAAKKKAVKKAAAKKKVVKKAKKKSSSKSTKKTPKKKATKKVPAKKKTVKKKGVKKSTPKKKASAKKSTKKSTRKTRTTKKRSTKKPSRRK